MGSKAALSTEELHREWRPVLELGTREVFELMLASQLSVADGLPEGALDVTAMVGLAGALSGIMTVRCPNQAAALMASKMLGVDLEAAKAEIADALGEICNMVAGNFKNKISGLGDGCMLSPPSVITGGDYIVHSQAETPALSISFVMESMPVLITLHVNS